MHTLQFATCGTLVRRIAVSTISIVAYYAHTARGAIFIGVQIFAANPLSVYTSCRLEMRLKVSFDSRAYACAHERVRYGNATHSRRLSSLRAIITWILNIILISFFLLQRAKKRVPQSKLLDAISSVKFREILIFGCDKWNIDPRGFKNIPFSKRLGIRKCRNSDPEKNQTRES